MIMFDLQKKINESIPFFLKKRHLMEMYSTVIEEYIEQSDTYCVCADLSRHTEFEGLGKRHPSKIINVGIAEQNLLGISAGLASNSNDALVFTQTLASFLLNRGFDVISQNICADNLNVKLLGNSSGLSTGVAGISHWIVNDLGMLKGLGNITILCPSDVFEVAKCVEYAAKIKGPFYIRIPYKFLRRENENSSLKVDETGFYTWGKGFDNVIISYGTQTEYCKNIAKQIPGTGVVELYNVNRFNEKKLLKILSKAKKVCFVEEHFISGGIGESIARLILENQFNCKYRIWGIAELPESEGSYEFLLKLTGLDENTLKKQIGEFLCRR